MGRQGRTGRGSVRQNRSFAAAIKLKPERFAEGRQRPFGGVGLGSFNRNVVHFSRATCRGLHRSRGPRE